MAEFTGKMVVGQWTDVEIRPGALWMIISPLAWIRPNGDRIDITPYFITDYASIPRGMQWLIPKRDVHYDVAALFHDDCLIHRRARGLRRKDCHDIFDEIMKHYKTPRWKRKLMYSAVTVVGWFSTNKGDGTFSQWTLNDYEKALCERIKQKYPWSPLN